MGVSPRAARTGAWHALVHDAPPSILADALGAHPATVHRYATAAGVDYARYSAAPGRAQ